MAIFLLEETQTVTTVNTSNKSVCVCVCVCVRARVCARACVYIKIHNIHLLLFVGFLEMKTLLWIIVNVSLQCVAITFLNANCLNMKKHGHFHIKHTV